MLRLQKELVESKERGIVFLVLCWDLGGGEEGVKLYSHLSDSP